MNLRETILKEHSKKQTLRIVNWVGSDKKRFAELVTVFLNGEYRVTQRAAWPLSYCVQEHPELVFPHLGKLISNLDNDKLHPAVARNTLRFLAGIDVPGKYLGKLAGTSFRLLQKADSPVAVKVFAMTVLLNITKKEPGLKRELREVIEDVLEHPTPGLRARARHVLKELKKL